MIADLAKAFVIMGAAIEAILFSYSTLILHQTVGASLYKILFVDEVSTIPAPWTAFRPADIENPFDHVNRFAFLAVGTMDPGIVAVEAAIEDLGEIALQSR